MDMPLNIDWQQILLHLFNFVVLFAVLYFLLYNPVKKFMDDRIEYYKKLDEDAEKKMQQATDTENEYKEKLRSLAEEIEQKRQNEYKQLSEEIAQNRLSAKKEAETIISDAHKRAENEHNKILENAQCEITEMVTSAAEKLVIQSNTAESYDSFLDAAERSVEDSE